MSTSARERMIDSAARNLRDCTTGIEHAARLIREDLMRRDGDDAGEQPFLTPASEDALLGVIQQLGDRMWDLVGELEDAGLGRRG